jgi:uncharacterized membrane protein YgcG
MLKRIAVSFALLLVLCGVALAERDTGTYSILDYRVSLTPRPDGKVDIGYYMKWRVLTGHIPWITVGLPNENFALKEHGLNARSVKPANEGSWSGVRIDLDRDYPPNQEFEVSFSIVQNRLFYADEKDYRLDFTPGWYDRAFTQKLAVSVRFFADMKTVKADPSPTRTEGETMVWERNRLGKGKRFSISVSFPKKAFPKEIAEDNLKEEVGIGAVLIIVVLVVGLGVLFVAAVLLFSEGSDDGDGYSSGGIYFGSSAGSGGGFRSSGGGGGFGGRSSSCACACVSCACACACAGGGGAGCSRKAEHSCPSCSQK